MKIQLTISLLVSDRMETLGKCLDSLKPLLQELDSELIAVFTGKEEETLELLQQYTPHIIPFEWCNDFSKARNAGLKEARGEWFLYLDDDEWFDDVTELIQFFQSGEYRQYQSGFYVARNYLDFEGKRYSDADVGRMCRLIPETVFIFPIHENLEPFYEPCKKFNTFVHHFGYARKEKLEEKDTKTSRNLPLLLEMLEKEPDSPQCHMQIAQEYRSVGEFEEAVRYSRKGIALAQKEKRIYNYELWFQVNLPLLISYTGDKELAIREAEQLLRGKRTLEMAAVHLCVTLVACCRDLKEYRKGLRYVRLYQEKLRYLHRHPDAALRQRAAGITLDEAVKEEVPVYVDGLFFTAETGNRKFLRELMTWIPWGEEERVSVQYPHLEEWKKKYPGLNEEILEGYAGLHTDNVYVGIQKVLHAEKHGDLQEAEVLWRRCAENCPAGFQWELIEIAVRNDFSLDIMLAHMRPEVWNEYAASVTSYKGVKELKAFYKKIKSLLADYPFYARKLEQSFLERMLTRELLDPSRPAVLLRQYCESVITDAKALYRDEVLADPSAYALPETYRFAAAAGEALTLIEEGHFAEGIPLLKDAAYMCPRMSAAVSQFLRALDEQVLAPKQTVSEEFMILGGQVKQVILGLMEKGQWEEAYGVMAQLVPLLPNDLEVLRMKQLILRGEA